MRSRNLLSSGAGMALFGSVLLWSCGGGSGTYSASPTAPAAPAPPQTVTVTIVGSIGNQAYRPNPVGARSGDTIVFKNDDRAMHHIVLDDGSMDFGEITPGASSKTFVVRNSNAAKYHCSVHPSMVGSINGQEAPIPPPCPDPYGYGC